LLLEQNGVVCLPVHDSFIVDHRYEYLLHDAMTLVFKHHVGIEPQIKKDKTVFDVMKSRPLPTQEEMIAQMKQIKLEGETGKGVHSRYQTRKAEWYMANRVKEPIITSVDLFVF